MPPPAAPAAATLTCAAWEIWQDGLAERFTLPADLPPLRMLLVWDNLTGHKSVGMVLWLCQHGIMPLYTPLGGSWLNMAESIQRILKRRTLDGQHPQNPAEIGTWFQQTAQAWNRGQHPFCGTASAEKDGASNAAMHARLAAQVLTPISRYHRPADTHKNGTVRGK